MMEFLSGKIQRDADGDQMEKILYDGTLMPGTQKYNKARQQFMVYIYVVVTLFIFLNVFVMLFSFICVIATQDYLFAILLVVIDVICSVFLLFIYYRGFPRRVIVTKDGIMYGTFFWQIFIPFDKILSWKIIRASTHTIYGRFSYAIISFKVKQHNTSKEIGIPTTDIMNIKKFVDVIMNKCPLLERLQIPGENVE